MENNKKFEIGKTYQAKKFVGMDSVAYATSGSQYVYGPKVLIRDIRNGKVFYECKGYKGYSKLYSEGTWESFKYYSKAPKDREDFWDTKGYAVYSDLNEIVEGGDSND